MSTKPTLNVSHLPSHGFDTRAPIWWGNLLLLMIETTMFGILVATYFYLSRNFNLWPPPHTRSPILYDSAPTLTVPTINLILLIASCAPMYWVDRSARRARKRATQTGLLICLALGLAAIALRWFEFPALRFKWYENAYGSTVWFLLGTHYLHLFVLTAETVFLTIWVFFRPFDEKHRVDITVLAVYWYWVVAIWLPLYTILYFGPRII
ncbi:MAG: cytochrome c oxidase subunit [Acidobacteriota bacterium]|jgi:heme/copper-type cytochrome/quinol oxidase subunit 3|nr:cytochrome c oxidase subunit [Acidobacteriota bacterium]